VDETNVHLLRIAFEPLNTVLAQSKEFLKMAERKVQSKYMPPDFDHRVLKAVTAKERKHKNGKTAKKKLDSVRIMLPFNVCCSNCNTYMYRGRKFNGKKEEGADPDYVGTKIIRFHFRCERCSSPIVYRTDPQTAGFVMVSGARENTTSAGNFVPLSGKEDDIAVDTNLDPIKALEARALETKREMDINRDLELELRNSQARVTAAKALMSRNGAEMPTSQSLDLDVNEEVELAAFRARKREMGMQRPADSSSTPSTIEAGALVKPLERSLPAGKKEEPGPQITLQRIAKKPKTLSFVPYADDDDD